MSAYLTVEQVTAYHGARLTGAAWDVLENKEEAIMTASDYLDTHWQFIGTKQDVNQDREFPRVNDYGDVFFPDRVKNAICELSLIGADLIKAPEPVKKSVKVDTLAVTFDNPTDAQGNVLTKLSRIEDMLRDLLVVKKASTTTAKLVRS